MPDVTRMLRLRRLLNDNKLGGQMFAKVGRCCKPTYRCKERAIKLTVFHEALVLAHKADARQTKQNFRTAKATFVQIKAGGYSDGYRRCLWLQFHAGHVYSVM